MAYTSSSDVATRLGRTLTTEETALVEARLDDVERRIQRSIPDLADKITADEIDVEDVKQVEADVVLRLVRNPEGYYSETDGSHFPCVSARAAAASGEHLRSGQSGRLGNELAT